MCFFNVAAATAATATATTAAAAAASTTDPDHEKKIISRQLSNYIMYIIFKCGVMLTSNSKFLLRKANDEIIRLIDAAGKDHHHHQQQQQGDPDPKEIKGRQREKVAVERLEKSALFQGIARELSAGADAAPFNPSDTEVLSDPVLPRAFKVAAALAGIREAGGRWDLIAAVWLEMLYYVATRCGAAFHREHLSTGGELVTHVLVLMYIVGPLGYHPSVLTETNT